MRRRKLRILIAVVLVTSACAVAALGSAWWQVSRCRSLSHDTVETLPHRKVGLVLGCAPILRDGSTNYFFRYRMDAAASLVASGKVDYLLVSGDNRRHDYDEPTWMKEALIARGVA